MFTTARWSRPSRPTKTAVALVAAAVVASSCAAPTPPAYPNWGPYGSRQAVLSAATDLSTKLERYIQDWMDNKVPAQLPESLVPPGRPKGVKNFVLQRPDQIDPNKQWMVRPAHTVNTLNEPALFPDPHVTYLVMPQFLLPFGASATVTGDFPKSRFFDIQTSPPFDPEHYYYGAHRGLGVAEVPLVDADITPDPGSTNPFKVGADRNATKRRYTVELKSEAGNASAMNVAYNLPYYRDNTNTRIGGGIEYAGPWGCTKDISIPPDGGQGCLTTGNIWVRYYAPDNGTGAKAGVALPKVTYHLRDGRSFYIQADLSEWTDLANDAGPLPSSLPVAPGADQGPNVGWFKEHGVLRQGMFALSPALGVSAGDRARYVRDFDKGVNSHGEDVSAPGNDQHGATEVNYVDYLARTMSLPSNMVAVITGKLPTTPKTRKGEPTMTAAQSRYWSITSYAANFGTSWRGNSIVGQANSSLMDDEIEVNENNEYTIVYSRPLDRPYNAVKNNNVTWADWGPGGTATFTIRWMSVGPEWTFCRAPDQNKLQWRSDPASPSYDPSLLANNNQTTFTGAYTPVVHYMTKQQFESLGYQRINPNAVPTWTDPNGLWPGPPAKPGPTGC